MKDKHCLAEEVEPVPGAGAIHCERQRAYDLGSARPSKKAGTGDVRRGVQGDWVESY